MRALVWSWAWSTARVGQPRRGEGMRGGGRAAAHYARKCAEEEWAKLYFRRACSAARCKGYSRHIPEDLSQALTLAEMGCGWRYFAKNLPGNFSPRKTWGTAPCPKKTPDSITELLDNGIEETPIVMEKHTVKHNVVLWLHIFFVYRVLIDANSSNFISLGIYSMLVKWNGIFHPILTGRENTFRL